MAETMSEIMNPANRQHDPQFPHAPEGWSSASAEATASADDLKLEADHWELISALQAFFAADETPNVRKLHDALDEHFHARGGIKYLYELLPGGPVAQGCRLAGLQAPAGAVDKSFGSVQ
ncbi:MULTISPECIES: TusE/DsrC/DsvC family sulfur relay protein [Thiorhodovibrio]|uniref:TusE/DsrC/DsvC family sulfur relay protein n=1 Tax=Thiorhodovibrio TaxID=61593 RepID=UPI001914CF3A|nr:MULTISPECIES: TusE/DsrC/DsvC family sulfur relay protein [Thiorhodovibrio]MBK5968567.1 sulfite reductase [Thiorhodovibrio winogradskyi]WPL11336.1 Sulfurtransferase TusE [Thiorhodovibrio litoralis]